MWGKNRPPRHKFNEAQLELAKTIERELARLSCLCTRHSPIPALEPFWVLGMDPTDSIEKIENRTAELLALYSEETVKRFGLHRQTGNWLKKTRLLYNQVAEAWLALESIQAGGQLVQYARSRGAPAQTVREAVPPRIKAAIAASANPSKSKPDRLPN